MMQYLALVHGSCDGAVSGEDRLEQDDGGKSSEEHVERIVDLSAGNTRM